MPIIQLEIDNTPYRFDSPDIELCGKWFASVLATFPITLASRVVLYVRPLYVPNPAAPWTGPGAPDWEPEYQRWHSPLVDSPADAARKLSEALAKVADELEGQAPAVGPVTRAALATRKVA